VDGSRFDGPMGLRNRQEKMVSGKNRIAHREKKKTNRWNTLGLDPGRAKHAPVENGGRGGRWGGHHET